MPSGSDLTVTLDVANLDELNTAAQLAGSLQGVGVGVDNVQINLGDANGDGQYQDDLERLLSGTISINGVEVSAIQDDLAALRQIDSQGLGLQVDTIDVGGASRNVDLTITEAQAHQLVQDGLHFASNEFVTLEASGVMSIDGIHASGTHLQSTLKDLQKLGVDSATGHTINNLGIDALSLSGVTELQDLSDLTSKLKAHGIDNLGLRSSELFDANGDETALFKAFETQDWINNGVKVALEVDNSSATAPDPTLAASTTEPILTNNAAINEFIQHGMDVLHNGGVHLAEGENWGSLIKTLRDS